MGDEKRVNQLVNGLETKVNGLENQSKGLDFDKWKCIAKNRNVMRRKLDM